MLQYHERSLRLCVPKLSGGNMSKTTFSLRITRYSFILMDIRIPSWSKTPNNCVKLLGRHSIAFFSFLQQKTYCVWAKSFFVYLFWARVAKYHRKMLEARAVHSALPSTTSTPGTKLSRFLSRRSDRMEKRMFILKSASLFVSHIQTSDCLRCCVSFVTNHISSCGLAKVASPPATMSGKEMSIIFIIAAHTVITPKSTYYNRHSSQDDALWRTKYYFRFTGFVMCWQIKLTWIFIY